MGIGYYLKNNQEPYVNPNTGKIDVRSPTPAGTDQWSAPTATPQQAAQISYAVAHTPAQVQQQQIAEEQARTAAQPVPDQRTAYALAQGPAKPAYIQLPAGDTGMPGLIGAVVIDRKPTPPSLPADQPRSGYTPAESAIVSTLYQSDLISSRIARDTTGGGATPAGYKASQFLGSILPDVPMNTGPVNSIYGGLRDFVVGMPQNIGNVVMGGEVLARNAIITNPAQQNIRNVAIGLTAKNTAESFGAYVASDPLRAATAIVGPALIAGAVGKGSAAIRARGLETIPTQDIGYGAEQGYPKVPGSPKVSDMAKSFETRTLIPEPVEMSTGQPAPYTFTEKNPAALPTDEAVGKNYAWTGWENKPAPREPLGKVYELGKGSSELPGASAAPVAELYFTHAGGMMPEVVGFDINPIKSPSVIRWELQDIQIAPRSARQDFGAANRFFASDKIQPGTGYIFGLKGEYELNIPMGNEFTLEKTGYRTTVTSTSQNRIIRALQTKAPIYEAKTTGVLRRAGVETPVEITMEGSYSSIRPKPILNLAYSGMPSYSIVHPLTTSSFVRETSSPINRESVTSEVSRIAPSSHVSSRYAPSETPRSSSSRRTPTTSVPPSSRPPSSSRPPGSYTPPYSKPPSYTPPRSTYRQPPYTPTYTPPRTGLTGTTRLPIPMGASLRGSSSRGVGWGMWKGTTRTNRVVGLTEFFGRIIRKRKP